MPPGQVGQPRSRANRQPAAREQSGSSVDEDTKISGNSASGASSSRIQKPALSVDVSASNDQVQKHEKIERIGMIRGSSHVRSKDKDAVGAQESTTSIGLQDDAVYDAYLSPPIAYLRRLLVYQLRREAPWHARHQKAVRRPWLDRYFVNTSLLGTHSFFLVFLPMTFWLGSPRFARGIINVLALGVYLSSAIKDLFCVPRPLSPPVTRLTIGTHHLEYGFVSTHSTNSVSIALFVYLWVRQIRQAQTIEDVANGIVGSSVISEATATIFSSRWWEISLLFYAISVVYGRIYAGMHSIMDCVAGSLLGAAITAMQWYFFDYIEDFIKIQSWYVPLAIIPAGLVMVSVHPQPVEDCPCFEDAIAFVSVSMGIALARWSCVNFDMMLSRDPFNHALSHLGQDIKQLAQGPQAKFRLPLLKLASHPGPAERLVKAALVLVLGVATVLMVRVIAKLACKILLPPIFRFVDELIGFSLPRRHYTQAKDYDNIPLDHLGSLPSAIDLPSQIFVTDESGKRHLVSSPGPSRQSSADVRNGSTASSLTALSSPSSLTALSSPSILPRSPLVASPAHSPVPSRSNSPNPIEARARLGAARNASSARRAQFSLGGSMDEDDSDLPIPLTQSKAHPNFVAPDEKLARHLAAELKGTSPQEVEKEVKHYDADVLTKVIVYANIGLFSGGFIPAFFERLGLI